MKRSRRNGDNRRRAVKNVAAIYTRLTPVGTGYCCLGDSVTQTANYWECSASVNVQELDKKKLDKFRSANDEEKYLFLCV